MRNGIVRRAVRSAAVRGAAALAAWAFAWAPGARAAEGISTDFGNVTLNNIPAGTPYVLTARPVRVANHGPEDVAVAFDAAVPDPARVLPGYEPIPDAGWITFKPKLVKDIGPDRTGESILTIAVPEGPKYAGRRFQADLFLHTTGSHVHAVSMGLKPRLCFAVAAAGVAVDAGQTPAVGASLTPPETTGSGGELLVTAHPLHVANRSKKDMTFRFGTPLAGAAATPSASGYEPLPAEARIICNPRTLTLRRGEEADVDVAVALPLDPAYAGRRFQALVASEAEQRGRVLHLLNVVLLEVPAWPANNGAKP